MILGHVNLQSGFRGGERQTELLIRELSARGYEQRLITRKGSALSSRLAGLAGVTIREISKPFLLNTGAAKGCDLLHAHETKAAQYAMLVRKFRGIPYVITRRVPKVPKNNPFTHAVYSNAEKITALSTAIRDNLLKFDPKLDVAIIPSMAASLPVDEERVAALRQRFAGKFVVGHIGALVNYHKGQQYLIEAAKQLQGVLLDCEYLFLGEGKDEAWFRQLSADMGNIHFIGFVDNVGDYIELFDLFVFPSLQEGLGSVLLDVMHAKKPIIASDVDGIPDIIHQGQNGLLVAPGDSNALAAAIERVYRDDTLRSELSSRASMDAESYLPASIAQKFIDNIYPKTPDNI